MSRRLFILVGALLFAVGVSVAAPGAARAEGFSGAGSTLAYPILATWARLFATVEGEGGALVSPDRDLAYEPVGSLGGVLRAIQGAVDFGATDVPLPPAELDRHGLAQFPFVTGGVAVVANVRGLASGALRLDGATLARIYLGEITTWSDPAIAALNPAVALPNAPIAVIRRRDGSGTTWHFASYLARASEAWKTRIGVDTELNWPTGVGAKGNQELAELVRATENAIGYVVASEAFRLSLSIVLVENAAGRFVAPTPAALGAAAETTVWDPARHFNAPLAASRNELANGAANGAAYPITATVFALMPRRSPAMTRARRTLDFFRVALTERAAEAAALGYVPLPPPVVRQVENYWPSHIRAAR